MCLYLASLLLTGCATDTSPPPKYSPLVEDAYKKIKSIYFYPADWNSKENECKAIIAEMLTRDIHTEEDLDFTNRRTQCFDKYTRRKPGPQWAVVDGTNIDTFGSTGMILTEICNTKKSSCTEVITNTVPGGPADVAGLKFGDILLSINDDRHNGILFSTHDSADALSGKIFSTATLTFKRGGTERRTKITREYITFPSVFAKKVDGVCVVTVLDFSTSAGSTFSSEVRRVCGDTVQNMVLDLRNNPGGDVPEALHVLYNFSNNPTRTLLVQNMRSETITHTIAQPLSFCDKKTHPPYCDTFSRYEGTTKILEQPGVFAQTNVAVLINGGTASAAEITAGALQSWSAVREPHEGVRKLFGEQSFGKFHGQDLFVLPDGSYFSITSFAFQPGISGPMQEGAKLIPDIPVNEHFDTTPVFRDAVLNAAINWLKTL